jgi:hypothetical protein
MVVLVGVAVSPGALLSPGVLVEEVLGNERCRWGQFWVLWCFGFMGASGADGAFLGFERCRSLWRCFLVMKKVECPPPTPARIVMVFVLGDGV